MCRCINIILFLYILFYVKAKSLFYPALFLAFVQTKKQISPPLFNSQSGPAEQGPQKTHTGYKAWIIDHWLRGEWNLEWLNPGDRWISVQIIQSSALLTGACNTENDQNTRMTSRMIAKDVLCMYCNFKCDLNLLFDLKVSDSQKGQSDKWMKWKSWKKHAVIIFPTLCCY